MTNTDHHAEPEIVTPDVAFNMDLANGHTSARFCYEAAAILGLEIDQDDAEILEDPYGEFVSEVVDAWTSALESAGYAVNWDAGDVVVWDLRPLTDAQQETFYASTEGF